MKPLAFAAFAMFLQAFGVTAQQCSNSNPCPIEGGEPLPRCEELVSKDGRLDVVLSVEAATFRFEWLELPRRSYNGTQCPPTWRVKPGDVVNVLLVNKLSGDNPKGKHNGYGRPNSTNLHTHGLHISSREPQDNVFVEVKPGESYQYLYRVVDDHPAGSFWYHAHVHGSTTLQAAGGLAGMLIVEDDAEDPRFPEELKATSCPKNCQHDIPIIVSPMLRMPSYAGVQKNIRDNMRVNNIEIKNGENLEDWLKTNVNYFTLNGKVRPTITIDKERLTRFRILHVGDFEPLELSIVDDKAQISPCDVREIATDGIYLDKPRLPKHGQTLLLPGNRKDLLINCKTAGEYKIVSRPRKVHKISFAGAIRVNITLATIRVIHGRTGKQLDFPTSLPGRPHFVNDLRNVKPDRTIVIELGGNNNLNRNAWHGPEDYRYKVEVNSVVEIQLVSSDYSFSHSMHIHVNHFQVISYEHYKGPVAYYKFLNPNWEMRDQETGELCYYQYDGYKGTPLTFNVSDSLKYAGHKLRWDAGGNDTLPYATAGDWMDTIQSVSLSNITLRMKTDRFTGPVLIHCHMPTDSDTGMMMVIEIVEKGADVSTARMDSGGAFPGSCHRCEWNLHKEIPDDCENTKESNFRYIAYILVASTLIVAAAALSEKL